jgi:hypothetical protein
MQARHRSDEARSRRRHGSALLCLTVAIPFEASWAVEGRSCAENSPFYTHASGIKVSVIRAGTLKQENALRPLSNGATLIWHVTVSGKVGFLARLNGELFEEVPSLAELEYVNSNSVKWLGRFDATPQRVRILTQKRLELGPLELSGCEKRPNVPVPKSAEDLTGARDTRQPRAGAVPHVPLPQGAIPD